MTPLGIVFLLLSGIAPLLAWRKTTRERLKNQFLFPLAFTALVIVGLLVLAPQTTHTSSLFADTIQLHRSR